GLNTASRDMVTSLFQKSGLPGQVMDTNRPAGSIYDWGSTGRNVGMDAAKGDWLLFPDDDDVYVPNAFQTIRAAVNQSNRHQGQAPITQGQANARADAQAPITHMFRVSYNLGPHPSHAIVLPPRDWGGSLESGIAGQCLCVCNS